MYLLTLYADKQQRYTSDQLYKDMTKSFQYLDSLVQTGTIGGYGICSNTMAFPTAEDHVSLTKLIQSCTRPENLVAIQTPFNLFEREAVISKQETVAEMAKKHGIYLMTNRPLNAIANGQIRVLVNHVLGSNGKGLAEHEIIDKMSQSFEKVTQLETDLISECK